MSEYDERVGFLAKGEAVERARSKLEHGEFSEKMRERLNEIAYGAEVAEKTRVKEKIEDYREERRDRRREREAIEDDIDELNRKIERAEERLDTLREQDGEYDGALAAVEAQLNDGVRVTTGAPQVQRAAELADCSPQEVIDDIRDRNPELPDMAFRPAAGTEDTDWKAEHTEHTPNENLNLKCKFTSTEGKEEVGAGGASADE